MSRCSPGSPAAGWRSPPGRRRQRRRSERLLTRLGARTSIARTGGKHRRAARTTAAGAAPSHWRAQPAPSRGRLGRALARYRNPGGPAGRRAGRSIVRRGGRTGLRERLDGRRHRGGVGATLPRLVRRGVARTEPHAAAPAIELRAAISDGKVSITLHGIGLERVQLTLTPKIETSIRVVVDPGTMLVPRASGTQTMVVIDKAVITLEPEVSVDVDLDVACAQMHDAMPESSDTFRVSVESRPIRPARSSCGCRPSRTRASASSSSRSGRSRTTRRDPATSVSPHGSRAAARPRRSRGRELLDQAGIAADAVERFASDGGVARGGSSAGSR